MSNGAYGTGSCPSCSRSARMSPLSTTTTATLTTCLALAGRGGVRGEMKNLIFAADGPKPRIVLRDAINNDLEIVENAEYCLVYDRPLADTGLTWRQLTAWRAGSDSLDGEEERAAARELYARLLKSMDRNGAERFVFERYCARYRTHGFDIPALIPQVYLHYDPYTRWAGGTLTRQRMDFLLLLDRRRRVVLEVDGVQHYADADGRASPARYAEMVSADRELRLAGYEVYRFGGHEIADRARPPASSTSSSTICSRPQTNLTHLGRGSTAPGSPPPEHGPTRQAGHLAAVKQQDVREGPALPLRGTRPVLEAGQQHPVPGGAEPHRIDAAAVHRVSRHAWEFRLGVPDRGGLGGRGGAPAPGTGRPGPHRAAGAQHRVGKLGQLISASGQAGMELAAESRQHGGWPAAGILWQTVHHGLR